MRFATMQIKAALCELIKLYEILPKVKDNAVPSGMFFITDVSTEVELRRL